MSELRQTGVTRFGLPVEDPGTGTDDALLAAVRSTAAPDYDVLGEIARSAHGTVLFLARAAADKGLIALRLTPGSEDQEFLLELVQQLDSTLPSPDGYCSRCGAQFVAWARFCSKCGSAIFGDAGTHESPHARAELRAAVEEAAAGRYEILGEMRHSDGPGVVYFARDIATGKIEALRVQPEGAEEFSVGKTNVMRRLSVSVQAARDQAPPTRPAPPAAQAVPPHRPAAGPRPPTPRPRRARSRRRRPRHPRTPSSIHHPAGLCARSWPASHGGSFRPSSGY